MDGHILANRIRIVKRYNTCCADTTQKRARSPAQALNHDMDIYENGYTLGSFCTEIHFNVVNSSIPHSPQ